jgi:hypothetical protein
MYLEGRKGGREKGRKGGRENKKGRGKLGKYTKRNKI